MCSIADSEAVEMGLHYNRELRFISKTHQDKKENQGFQNSWGTWISNSPQPPVGLPDGSAVKNPPANTGDPGMIPGSGRSPGEGNCNLLR